MKPEDMISRLSGPVSLRRRILSTIAMLGGLTGAAVIGLLWATEPGLPLRTQAAFGLLVVIGLCWAAYGSWVLTRKTPLFALDRVVAAWLALAATGLLTIMTAVITTMRHHAEPALFAIVALLLVLSTVNLARSRAHRAKLLRRKQELGG
jgi:hypothetical protein